MGLVRVPQLVILERSHQHQHQLHTVAGPKDLVHIRNLLGRTTALTATRFRPSQEREGQKLHMENTRDSDRIAPVIGQLVHSLERVLRKLGPTTTTQTDLDRLYNGLGEQTWQKEIGNYPKIR